MRKDLSSHITLNFGAFSLDVRMFLDTMPTESVEGQTVWCLPFYLGKWRELDGRKVDLTFLVLQEADADSELNSFTRIGRLRVSVMRNRESLGNYQIELDPDKKHIWMSDKADFSNFRLV